MSSENFFAVLQLPHGTYVCKKISLNHEKRGISFEILNFRAKIVNIDNFPRKMKIVMNLNFGTKIENNKIFGNYEFFARIRNYNDFEFSR